MGDERMEQWGEGRQMPESMEKEVGRERSGHLDRDSRSLWSGSHYEAMGAMALHAAGGA